ITDNVFFINLYVLVPWCGVMARLWPRRYPPEVTRSPSQMALRYRTGGDRAVRPAQVYSWLRTAASRCRADVGDRRALRSTGYALQIHYRLPERQQVSALATVPAHDARSSTHVAGMV